MLTNRLFTIRLRETYKLMYVPEHTILIEIETLKVLRGKLPGRALAMILEWAFAHRDELMENWKLAEDHQPLKRIKPLE